MGGTGVYIPARRSGMVVVGIEDSLSFCQHGCTFRSGGLMQNLPLVLKFFGRQAVGSLEHWGLPVVRPRCDVCARFLLRDDGLMSP